MRGQTQQKHFHCSEYTNACRSSRALSNDWGKWRADEFEFDFEAVSLQNNIVLLRRFQKYVWGIIINKNTARILVAFQRILSF